MRISDWSSDVCSSDLAGHQRVERFSDRASGDVAVRQGPMVGFVLEGPVAVELHFLEEVGGRTGLRVVAVGLVERDGHARSPCRDRKSGVWAKSVSVRVDLVGRRYIKKKTTTHI